MWFEGMDYIDQIDNDENTPHKKDSNDSCNENTRN